MPPSLRMAVRSAGLFRIVLTTPASDPQQHSVTLNNSDGSQTSILSTARPLARKCINYVNTGVKSLNIQAKVEASKIKWLIDLWRPKLTVHLALKGRLLGEQKGKYRGNDLFFTTKRYARKVLGIASPFYTEAIKIMTTHDLRKQVLDPRMRSCFIIRFSREGMSRRSELRNLVKQLGFSRMANY